MNTGLTWKVKNAVVIGRSNIVGKPIGPASLAKNATVTLTHSRTHNLAKVAAKADILVVAIGRAKFVTADFVKPGAVVIDVGMNRDEMGSFVGMLIMRRLHHLLVTLRQFLEVLAL